MISVWFIILKVALTGLMEVFIVLTVVVQSRIKNWNNSKMTILSYSEDKFNSSLIVMCAVRKRLIINLCFSHTALLITNTVLLTTSKS